MVDSVIREAIKKMNRIIILIIAGISILASCRSAKKIQSPIVIKDTTVTEINTVDIPLEDSADIIRNNYKEIKNNLIKATTFSAKIDVKYKDAEGKKV